MSGRPQRAVDVEGLLSDSIVYELWGSGDPADIHPLEESLVAGAIESRRAEFAAGRSCARHALADLGIGPVPMLRGELRSPIWPTGATGSISHTDGYALAAARRTDQTVGGPDDLLLGLDAERIGRVKPELYRRLFTQAEQEWLGDLGSGAATVATAMFGCKESLYKAQFVTSSAWVGFHDVEVRGRAPDGRELMFELHPVSDLAVLDRFQWPAIAGSIVKDEVVVSVLEVRPIR